MLYIAENLKALRKTKDLTQEEAAEMLGVSGQSVSKWERGDTYPDITLLPALANLYKVSVDSLIGMDKINDIKTKADIFNAGHKHLREGNINAAITVYSEALRTFPNDEGLMSDLAMALALDGGTEKLKAAISLCERILSSTQGHEKVHHTTRAAFCFILMKIGEKEKAIITARKLPHVRESRESILAQLENELNPDTIDSYLKLIAIGEGDQQDIILIDFGENMIIPICEEHDLTGKITALRNEMNAPCTTTGFKKLPVIRVRDNVSLLPNQVRFRYYADYLIDKEFTAPEEAVHEIIAVFRKMVQP